jgi:hypothetical protein
MQTVKPIETGTIDDLMHSVLIPSFQPTRSQWKKIENALRFINNSKQSAHETRERKVLECKGTNKQTKSMERLEDMASEALDSSYNHHMDMVPHSYFCSIIIFVLLIDSILYVNVSLLFR